MLNLRQVDVSVWPVVAPWSALRVNAGDYSRVPVDRRSHLWSDPLVEVSERKHRILTHPVYWAGDCPTYPRRIDGSESVVRLRSSMVDSLRALNGFVADYGLRLLVLDGRRTIECQRGLWAHCEAQVLAQNAGIGKAELRRRVLTFVSDPSRFKKDDPTTWPTHCTGGSADLVLVETETGRRVWMGSEFDECSERAAMAYLEGLGSRQLGKSGLAARRYRRILYWGALHVGLVPYMGESWHLNHAGTQMGIACAKAHGLPEFNGGRAVFGPMLD